MDADRDPAPLPLPGFFEGTEMPESGWWEALWPDPAKVIASAGITPGMEVVDLCAGDGWFTLQIARLARRVVAIDIDPQLVQRARQRLAERGAANCEFIAADAYRVAELIADRVDFVFIANAFHGVPDKPRLARAVGAALKPNGRFAIVNWHRRPREQTVMLGEPRGPRTELRLSPEHTITAVEAGGLQIVAVADIPPYHYAAIFAAPTAVKTRPG